MKKRLLSALLAVAMLFNMIPTAFAAEGDVAKIGEDSFATLEDAIDAAESGDTITLLQDTVSGVFIDVGANCADDVTFDLNNFTLTLDPSGGSTGTKTNGFRVLKGYEATVKNGKVAAHFTQENRVKVVFANYGTLTLENVEIEHTGNLEGDAGSLVSYTINNGGKLDIVKTEISNAVEGATAGNYAIVHEDYDYGNTSVISIDKDSKVIGDIYVGEGTSESVLTSEGDVDGEFIESEDGAQVEIVGGTYTDDVSAYIPAGLAQDESGNVVTDPNSIVKIGNIGYTALAAAIEAAQSGDTITLLDDVVSGVFIDVGGNCADNVTFDLNGFTLTLDPSGGSAGTTTNGFRVLSGNKATVKNGTVVAEFSATNRVKVVFANYGTLILEDVTVQHSGNVSEDAGAKVAYTINNGGKLEIKNSTITNAMEGAADGNYVVMHDDYNASTHSVITVDESSELTGDVYVGVGTEASKLTSKGILNGSFVDNNEGAVVVVAGGYYSEQVDEKYLKTGLDTELQHENGMFSYYGSVKSAAKAAEDGDIIVDLNDDVKYCAVYFNTGKSSTSWVDYVQKGKKISEPEEPEKTGYIFDGWYLGKKLYDFSDKVTESITLKADWVKYVQGEFKVTVKSAKNGDIEADWDYADKGDTVTIKVKPDKGYVLETLTVTDEDGDEVALVKKSETKYSFKMPKSKVTVKATFIKAEDAAAALPFADVNKTDAYYEAVKFMYENGLMAGINDGTLFAPQMPLSRAMTARIFHTLEKNPTAGASSFTDVARGMWYTNAIDWASAAGVVSGYGNGAFGPNDDVTREQLAVMLFQYAKSKGYNVSGRETLSAADAANVSTWAADAVKWAAKIDALTANGVGYLAANGVATRADVAQAFMAFVAYYG